MCHTVVTHFAGLPQSILAETEGGAVCQIKCP